MKKNEITKANVAEALLPDHELTVLADKIVEVIDAGKQALAININETIKQTYWQIGRHIVEFEQGGNTRASTERPCCRIWRKYLGQKSAVGTVDQT